jgi:hypothetical protein
VARKRKNHDQQNQEMCVRELRGSDMQVRMPEHDGGGQDDRLRVRRCVQVRSELQLQGVVECPI